MQFVSWHAPPHPVTGVRHPKLYPLAVEMIRVDSYLVKGFETTKYFQENLDGLKINPSNMNFQIWKPSSLGSKFYFSCV